MARSSFLILVSCHVLFKSAYDLTATKTPISDPAPHLGFLHMAEVFV